MSLLRRAARRLFASRALARALLGIEVPPVGPGRRYFDVTTIVLIGVVRRRVDASSRVLDMGTGAFAAIGLALWKRTGCRVVSSDVDAGLVEQARANVAANDAPIEVVHSRFFDGVFAPGDDGEHAGSESGAAATDKSGGGFDCVTFNAPYVPSRAVGADGGDDRYALQSDGGEHGTDVIEGFLRAFESEPRVALAYLGVNRLMVPRRMVEGCIADRSGLRLEAIAGTRLLPVDVYVVGKAAFR